MADQKDIKTLKKVRCVCKLWKQEAFVAFKTDLSKVPWVVVSLSPSCLSGVCVDGPRKSLQNYIDRRMPGSGFPVKLIINKWTPELSVYLRDFAFEIAAVLVYWSAGQHFLGVEPERSVPKLSALEYTEFQCYNLRNNAAECEDFVRTLQMWRGLSGETSDLKSRRINLGINNRNVEGKPLALSNAVFDQVQWNQVYTLHCNYEFFVELTACQVELTGLQELRCLAYANRIHGNQRKLSISFDNAAKIASLELGSGLEWNLNRCMQNLRSLVLRRTTFIPELLVSELLPQLETIQVYDGRDFIGSSCLFGFVNGAGVFERVLELKLGEMWTTQNEQAADEICNSFPNLRKLDWSSVCGKHALRAAPHIFTKLEFLTSLKLKVARASPDNIVELIAGISVANIPVDEGAWPLALLDNTRSITNLKRKLLPFRVGVHIEMPLSSSSYQCIFSLDLKTFELANYIDGLFTGVISGRYARFLFVAAFRTMENLQQLAFNRIISSEDDVIYGWERMGRVINVLSDFTDQVR